MEPPATGAWCTATVSGEWLVRSRGRNGAAPLMDLSRTASGCIANDKTPAWALRFFVRVPEMHVVAVRVAAGRKLGEEEGERPVARRIRGKDDSVAFGCGIGIEADDELGSGVLGIVERDGYGVVAGGFEVKHVCGHSWPRQRARDVSEACASAA